MKKHLFFLRDEVISLERQAWSFFGSVLSSCTTQRSCGEQPQLAWFLKATEASRSIHLGVICFGLSIIIFNSKPVSEP